MPLDDFTYNIYTRPSIAYVYDYSLFRVFHRVIFWLLVCVNSVFQAIDLAPHPHFPLMPSPHPHRDPTHRYTHT